jgi:hypothetical protein
MSVLTQGIALSTPLLASGGSPLLCFRQSGELLAKCVLSISGWAHQSQIAEVTAKSSDIKHKVRLSKSTDVRVRCETVLYEPGTSRR